MRDIFICIFFLCTHTVLGQFFPVSSLADSIIENNHSIIREDYMSYDVISSSEARQRVRLVRTILDKHGSDHQKIIVHYSDLRILKELEVKVYNREGKQIKKFKQKDFEDWAAYDGVSILSDSRVKKMNITTLQYPITIDLEYEIETSNLMFYPNFYFDSSQEPVEHSSLQVLVPKELGLNYKMVNMSRPVITELDHLGKTVYSWTKENSPKTKREPYGPPSRELLSAVYLSPAHFVLAGMKGSMDTWEDFGNFQYRLNQGIEGLSEEKIREIRDLTAKAGSTEEKIKIVYSHLQNTVRYVSVQLGIGGWRPFSPRYVEENGYGDCKALSFYTKSLLEAIDIPANYTLVYAGDNRIDLDPNFPTRAFNHAILSVPNDGDTLWLECTSQTNPFGYSGHFTGDREVLVVANKGSRIVKTPVYTIDKNTQLRKGEISINESGEATVAFATEYMGLQYENDNLDFVLNYGHDKQQKWITENLDLPNFELLDFEMYGQGDLIPKATVKATVRSSSLLQSVGSRQFLNPNLLNKWTFLPKKIDDRKTEVRKQNAYRDIDSLWFDLPSNMYPEHLNEPITVTSEFGKYEASVSNIEGRLLYVRKMELYKGVFPAESYENLRSFYSDVKKADNSKIILRKGT